jgi:hypothetical protein
MRRAYRLPPAIWLLITLVAVYAANEACRMFFRPSAVYVAVRAAVVPLFSLVTILSGIVVLWRSRRSPRLCVLAFGTIAAAVVIWAIQWLT